MTRRYRHDGDGSPARAKGVVHELVADTAKAIAGAEWEGRCSASDNFYRDWPNVNVWIRKRWPSFIQDAKAHLAEMLHPNLHYALTERDREKIFEALKLQAAVNPAENHVDAIIKGN